MRTPSWGSDSNENFSGIERLLRMNKSIPWKKVSPGLIVRVFNPSWNNPLEGFWDWIIPMFIGTTESFHTDTLILWLHLLDSNIGITKYILLVLIMLKYIVSYRATLRISVIYVLAVLSPHCDCHYKQLFYATKNTLRIYQTTCWTPVTSS